MNATVVEQVGDTYHSRLFICNLISPCPLQKTSPRKPLYKSLYVQVLMAVTLGVLLGHFSPELGAQMKPLGDGFIKLIKMIIAPIGAFGDMAGVVTDSVYNFSTHPSDVLAFRSY